MERKPLPHKTKLLYGMGAFGYGSIGQTMNSFLMFFGTGILGIPGALMGIAIAISTIWDASTDPVVGYYSDKTRSPRFGKRHGFILVGCFAVAFANLSIWSISPNLPTGTKFTLLLVLLLLMETFNTVYSTPYQALGLDLSATYEDRTAVQAYRTIFGFSALLVPTLLMTIFLSPGRYTSLAESAGGFRAIALFTSALCIICGLIVFFGTFKHRQYAPSQAQPNTKIFSTFFSILKQKNIGILIMGYAISLGAAAFITSLGLHIFTYTFQFSTLQIPFIMVALILGIILGQPLWFFYARKTDKISALLTALVVVICGMLMFSLILATRNTINPGFVLPLVVVTLFVCGIGTGCLYSLPISMFADCIELERERTGEDKTAISAGFLTFCTKISNAFIMFIIGISLDLIGFSGAQATQPMRVQNWLGWLLVSGVTIACVSAMFVYSRYSYRRENFKQS